MDNRVIALLDSFGKNQGVEPVLVVGLAIAVLMLIIMSAGWYHASQQGKDDDTENYKTR